MTRTIASRRQRGASGRFVGRHAEQQLFRSTLRQVAALRGRPDAQLADDDLSYAQIFLVAAEGGMGKTMLLRRFAEIVREDADGAGAWALYLDWERHPLIGSPDRIMDVLHQELCAAGFERELQPYRDAQVRRAEAQRKAADAEEKYRSLMHGAGGTEELRVFIQKKLAPDEWKLYDDPEALTEPFMEGLNRIATPARPLVLLLDTYELADHCDSWLRKRALDQSNPRLVWVLAGREGQPFIRRYEDQFGGSTIGRILLDTFDRRDIVAYVQQCGVAAPDDGLIERLQALSRGVPLALEGWFNLYQQNVELPPPDPAAATTRRAIVRRVTDRFLRYCNEDDKHLPPAQQRAREATRNNILALMLLRRTDADALAAAWQCDREEADGRLNELADTFSFVFAQEIEREPHALVKEFLREYLREQTSLPIPIQIVVERLVAHFEGRMRGREQELVAGTVPTQPLSSTEREVLAAERAAHQRALRQLQGQIAAHTEISAPVHLLSQRDDAEGAIKRIDAQLTPPATEGSSPTPRRPLWSDDAWRATLLDLLNALCWADRSGEKAMRLLVPMFVEALAFHQDTAAALLTTAEEFAGQWQLDRRQLFEVLAAGRSGTSRWNVTDDEMRAILDGLQPAADHWRLSPLHRAILYIQRGQLMRRLDSGIKSENLASALAAADEAARLLPADGGELAETLAQLYKDVGSSYLWLKRNEAVESPEAVRALTIATQIAPTNAFAWYDLGVSLYRVKRSEEAIASLQQYIAYDPTSGHAYNWLGNVHANLKHYEEAIAAYQQAIALDPTDGDPHNNLGNVYANLKHYEEAIAAYQQAIALDPTFAWSYNNLGNVYYDLKRYEEAIAAYQQSIALDPTFAYSHNGLGNVYGDLKRYEEAIAAYQQSIALDPTDASLHYDLGNMYSLLNRLDEARAAYGRAIELDPEEYRSIFGLARLERQAKHLAEAAALVDRARPLLPADDFYNRACLESIAGDADAAVEALRVALERGESSVAWAREDPDLAFIRDDPRYRALVGLDEG